MNRQNGNVGNVGDVLKHAALVELAAVLRGSDDQSPTNYFETNAYRLSAPCPDADRWRREVEARGAGYRRYAEREEERMRCHGDYRCSTGLVIDTLGAADVSLFLAEADAETRRQLVRQLESEKVAPQLLVNDCAAFAKVDITGRPGRVLGLVDPFRWTAGVWEAACALAGALRRSQGDGVIEVFHYSESPVSWPKSPRGFVGPVAILCERPFQLAAYATPSLRQEVRAKLFDLGWAGPFPPKLPRRAPLGGRRGLDSPSKD